MAANNDAQLITVQQAAVLLNCLPAVVHKLVRLGRIEAIGEKPDLQILLASVLQYLTDQRMHEQKKPGAKKTVDPEGTVFFDASKGLWYAQSMPDRYGKREKSRGVKTREEAASWLDQHRQDVAANIKSDWGKRPLRDYLEFWLEERRNSGELKQTTLRGYSQKVRLYICQTLGHIRLADIEADDWHVLDNSLREATEEKPGYAPNTVLNTYRCFKTALSWAVTRRYLRANPLAGVKAPAGGRLHQPVALVTHQVEALLNAVRGHRLYALYLIAVRLGLRQGELLGLRCQNLDLERGEIHVVEQLAVDEDGNYMLSTTKNKKDRRLPLSKELIDGLRVHLELVGQERSRSADWDLVFGSEVGTPISPRNLVRHFKACLKKAGLPQEMHFHDLRHTAGSAMLNAGEPLLVVSAILGHSNAEVTAKVYAHTDLDALRRTVENMAQRFTMKAKND